MNLFIADFMMHGKKSSRLGRQHPVISFSVRALAIKWMIIMHWISAITLMIMITQAFMDSHI
jgi:hypothetical protein